MADPLAIPRVRGNVEKMIGAGAPAHDIDDYLASEGYTPDTFRSAVKTPGAVGQGGAPAMPPEPSPERGLLQRGADFMRDQAAWQVTRGVNAAANSASFGDMISPAAPVRNALAMAFPQTMADLDSGKLLRRGQAAAGVPVVNTPEQYGGKVADAAVEAAIGSAAFPGSGARNVFPAAVGGAASEGAGQATAGSRWEIPARVAAGAAGGVAAAGLQAGGGAVVKGVRNALGANNADDVATGIVARAATRDKLTPKQLMDQAKALGDDAMPVDAGGENVKGALRGSIAAPGEARTTVRNAFMDRAEKEGARVGASVDRNVSPKGLTQTVDDIIEARARASRPAYEAAGVPSDPKAYAAAPQLSGQAVTDLIKNSADVRRAIAAAKRLPDYKDLPDTSMVLLDKAYKNIGGMADEARRAGNGERFRDMESLRRSLLDAIDAENKQYSVALATFSEPSKLKDAAELGAKLFSANTRPDVVKRDFARLSDDAKEAFRVGVAEHLRKVVGARDSTNVAGRVMGGPDAQARLTAVLGKDEAERIMADLAREKTFTRTMRDVTQGSRTAPMLADAADNADAAGAVSALARGEPVNALMRTLKSVGGRVTEGRNEAVNKRVAEILTSMKPEDRTAMVNAFEQSIARQRLTSPRNAFRAGAIGAAPDATRRRRDRE